MKGEGRAVLVLDGEWESSLEIVRSLGKKGIAVDVGSSRPHPIASVSRFCRRFHHYPDPFEEGRGFRDFLLRRVKARSYSLVIPVTDATISPIMSFRKELEEYTLLTMAQNTAIRAAQSKDATCGLAKSLDVPIPRTFRVDSFNEYSRIRASIGFPAVVKPDRSKVWLRGGKGLSLFTGYALHALSLDESVRALLEHGPVLLQEFVKGEVVGLGVLASRGEPLHVFQFRSIHEVPLTGGISAYRVSEPVDPELARYASRLLKALQWDGIAHVEFVQDRASGACSFMEINGRFWASLPLAVKAGSDFPFFLYQSLVEGRRDFPGLYRTGLRGHQLSREREWLKAVILGRWRNLKLPVAYPNHDMVVNDVLRLLSGTESIDTFDAADPAPAFHDVWEATVATVRDIKAFLGKKTGPG